MHGHKRTLSMYAVELAIRVQVRPQFSRKHVEILIVPPVTGCGQELSPVALRRILRR